MCHELWYIAGTFHLYKLQPKLLNLLLSCVWQVCTQDDYDLCLSTSSLGSENQGDLLCWGCPRFETTSQFLVLTNTVFWLFSVHHLLCNKYFQNKYFTFNQFLWNCQQLALTTLFLCNKYYPWINYCYWHLASIFVDKHECYFLALIVNWQSVLILVGFHYKTVLTLVLFALYSSWLSSLTILTQLPCSYNLQDPCTSATRLLYQMLQDPCREQYKILVWSTTNLFWTKWDLCISSEDFSQILHCIQQQQ